MKHELRNAMPTKPSDPFIPSWSQDQLDSPSPPETEAAYFDHLLNAWVLSKHADILRRFVHRVSPLPALIRGKPLSRPTKAAEQKCGQKPWSLSLSDATTGVA
jgi:hypothetical protein